MTEAVQAGARILCEGPVPSETKGTPGDEWRGRQSSPAPFYPATVLTDVRPEMRIAVEETFGPVVTIGSGGTGDAPSLSLGPQCHGPHQLFCDDE